MNNEAAAPLIYIVTGEPSGDVLGARLMRALRDETGGAVRFAGVGGDRMAAEGLASLVPLSELAVMGLAEVLPHARQILRRIREIVADIRARRPAAVVTIDSSSFTWRIARRLREAGDKVPLIHYVAPMVWAWRPGRAREMARWYDELLALLPFEPPYFEAVGLACAYVGHSVIESGANRGDGAGFRARYGIAADTPLLAVLPGSRRSEVRRLLGVFGEAVALLAKRAPGLRVVIPTVSTVAPTVREGAARWKVPYIIVEGEGEKINAFAASNAALAASGTVTLELAMASLPAVIAYRVSPLTHAIVRRMVKVKYTNLVNLLLDREAVPELIQQDCTAERLADAVTKLLVDETACAAQVAAYDQALDRLGRGKLQPSAQAAREILGAIAGKH